MPYDPEEHERRLQVLWRGKAEDFLRDIRPRTPPTGWAFVGSLQAFLRSRQLDTPIKYDEDEAVDWRSFRAWYLKVSEDLHKLVELLEDHEKWPCDPEQQQRIIDRGYMLKDAYRNWHERGAIKWLPEDHAIKTERGREPCTVIEFCAHALMSCEHVEAKGKDDERLRARTDYATAARGLQGRAEVQGRQGQATDSARGSGAQA